MLKTFLEFRDIMLSILVLYDMTIVTGTIMKYLFICHNKGF